MLSKIVRDVLALIPGTAPNVAFRKRALQRELQATGMSRVAAMREVSRQYGARGDK
jgi:hypothetical protein